MDKKIKNSYDYVADAVRAFWEKDLPQDVVAFFYQKYEFEDYWELRAELAFSESDNDYETVTFKNDFCEGQTCVRDISIIPLSVVLEFYASCYI